MYNYVKPKKFADVIIKNGLIVWEPYIRLKYETKKGKVDVIIDSLVPKIGGDAIVTVLLSRKSSLFKFVEKEPINGLKLDHKLDAKNIISLIKKAYNIARDLSTSSEKDFYERTQLDVDWSRYRAIFWPSKRIIERKEPIFRYLTGKDETPPYVIGKYIMGLIESGLKLNDVIDAHIHESGKIYYPLLITPELKVYEIGWKLNESIIYSWILENYPDVKSFYTEKLRNLK